MKDIINWLERKNLNHAGIVLLGMYPMIKINELIKGNEWTAALMWILVYYSREVTAAQHSGRDMKAFLPQNWPTRHDRLQTLYLVVVAIMWAVIYNFV